MSKRLPSVATKVSHMNQLFLFSPPSHLSLFPSLVSGRIDVRFPFVLLVFAAMAIARARDGGEMTTGPGRGGRHRWIPLKVIRRRTVAVVRVDDGSGGRVFCVWKEKAAVEGENSRQGCEFTGWAWTIFMSSSYRAVIVPFSRPSVRESVLYPDFLLVFPRTRGYLTVFAASCASSDPMTESSDGRLLHINNRARLWESFREVSWRRCNI